MSVASIYPQAIWSKKKIAEKLRKDDRWLYRAILAIYNRQTVSEQRDRDAKILNGVGFNKPDSPFLSHCAITLKAGRTLSSSELIKARCKMIKYVGQLVNIANNK